MANKTFTKEPIQYTLSYNLNPIKLFIYQGFKVSRKKLRNFVHLKMINCNKKTTILTLDHSRSRINCFFYLIANQIFEFCEKIKQLNHYLSSK